MKSLCIEPGKMNLKVKAFYIKITPKKAKNSRMMLLF